MGSNRRVIENPNGRSPPTDSCLPHAAGRALEAPEVVEGCTTPSKPTMFKGGQTIEGTQGPPGSWNKLQTNSWNSTGFPEGRFGGSDRLPVNLRGTSTENRDHSDPRTPQDIRETLRKPRSQVPRSSRDNGLRLRTTSQRSHTRQKGHRNKH
ncbi:hypothetical protein CRG98_011161 [Punica granatum]|uniref:Uncharacterized protein n=1 Tax=Punica granatum TaxID=22663 RepID=A0A2I0KIX7_PUNGR|nr:hypothetical protein CRG98_011161 [Punica granatum]